MTTSVPPRTGCRRPGRQRGFALLIVLWTLALLSLLVSAITAAGGGRARQAGEFARNAALRACADGGVDQALFHVLDPSGARWLADGQVRRLNGEGCALLASVTSQDGKINPNVASAPLLTGLLRAAGADARQATQIATAMVAWRFPAGQQATLAPPGLDYRPPGSAFESLDEIALVPGMTPALLRRIAPVLSLYHDGDPTLADADPLVRQAVNLSAGAGADPDAPDAQSAAAPTSSSGERFDPAVVEVMVEAADKQGHRFRRRAIALTGSNAGPDPSGAAYPYRIVAWEAP